MEKHWGLVTCKIFVHYGGLKYFWPTDSSLEQYKQWLFLSVMQQILQNERYSDICLVMKSRISEQSFLFQKKNLSASHLLSRCYKDYVCSRFIVLDLIIMIQRLLENVYVFCHITCSIVMSYSQDLARSTWTIMIDQGY